MNKTIPTAVGILIIVLVAGVAGTSVLFFNQEIKKAALEEDAFVEEDEKEVGLIKHTSEIFPLDFEYPEHLEIEKTISGENIIEGTNINSWANITVKDGEKRIFLISAGAPHQFPWHKETEEVGYVFVDGLKSMQMKKENQKYGLYDEMDFEYYIQTVVEFSDKVHYLFLSDGENDYYDEILSSVKFSEKGDFKIEKEDEFAGWNNYRNEKIGFELKFPKNWFKEKCKKIDQFDFKEIEMADCISITDPVIKRKAEMELGGPGFMNNISIEIEKPINYGVKNLSEYIELLTTKDDEGRIIGGANKLGKTNFLGRDTYIMSPIGHAGAEGIFIVFEKDNYLYKFIFGEYYEDSLVDFKFETEDKFVLRSPEIVGKILSTFRFLD